MTTFLPETVRRFLDDLTHRLEQDQGDNLVEVRLFGSHARGDARPDSDVDVLVVVEELPPTVKDRILEILADTALDHEVAVSPLIWDRQRWCRHEALQTLLMRHLQSEGVVIFKAPLPVGGVKHVSGRVIKLDARAVKVSFPDDETFRIDLADGRALIVPIRWSRRLSQATPEQRANVRIAEEGRILSWPDVDEDIDVPSLLKADELFDWP